MTRRILGPFLIATVVATLWVAYLSQLPSADAQVGPPNQIQCNTLAQQSVSSSAVLTLVAGITNTRVNICGWHVTTSASTSQTFQLISGTGTNCGTTSSIVTPPYALTNSAPSTDHIDYASLSLAIGNNLCVQSSGTVNQIGIWTSQQ